MAKSINVNTPAGEARIRIEAGDTWANIAARIGAAMNVPYRKSQHPEDQLYDMMAPGIGKVEDWNQGCYDLLEDESEVKLVKAVIIGKE